MASNISVIAERENASKGKLNFVANKQANLDDWKVSVNENDELTFKIVVVTEVFFLFCIAFSC